MIDKLKALLADATTEDYRAIERAILGGEDGFRDIQGMIERQSMKQTQAKMARLQREGRLSDDGTDIYESRLDAIERAYEDKVKAIDVSYHAKAVAARYGVPDEVLVGRTFSDKAEADEYVSKMAEAILQRTNEEATKRLAESHQPGSGDVPDTDSRYSAEMQQLIERFTDTLGR